MASTKTSSKSAPQHRAWQRMLSGRRLDLLNPSPVDIEIEDIAHGLSRMSRWNGQTSGKHCFSVAAHSMIVEAIYRLLTPSAPPKALLFALLHDAPEYVIGDLISPFKQAIGKHYKDLEYGLQAAIHLRFGLVAAPNSVLVAAIKKADLIAAHLEAVQLAGFEPDMALKLWGKVPDIVQASPICQPLDYILPNEKIKKLFLERFNQLDQK